MKTQNKKILLACIIGLFSLTTMSASAQLSLGARAGANLVTEPTNDYYHDFLALPYIGIVGQYKVTSSFDLQLSLNYAGEGTNLKDLSSGDVYHARQSYLTVPLTAQYRFGFGGYIEVGPQLGFLLSASSKVNGDPSENDKDLYKSTELSGIIGIGYEFNHTAPKGLGVNFRYSRSLSAINKISDGNSSDDVKNRVLAIGLTYRFGDTK